MITLGIESSCDETGVALYCTERGLLAHALFSQVDLHGLYGGVVPELASRDHIRRLIPLCREVCQSAQVSLAALDAVAFTRGPGLAGALLAGAQMARSLSYALGIPAVGVHHMEGHLLAPMLETPAPAFPFVCLLVSGGHTQLIAVNDHGHYQLLGESIDDAAGEAFDKTAKMLGLPYPGGAALSALAEKGDAEHIRFPRPMLDRADLNFSFSGLKTAAITYFRSLNELDQKRFSADIAASFEQAVVDVLIGKSERALRKTGLRCLVISGGVSANRNLRAAANALRDTLGVQVFYPSLEFCTDNGAMIALAGAWRLKKGETADLSVTVKPRWSLTELMILKPPAN